jgi:carboxyl-terminal processing protease
MKNGFIKGLLLGVGVCILAVLGFNIVVSAVNQKKRQESGQTITIGSPSPSVNLANNTPTATITPAPTEAAAVTPSPIVSGVPTVTPTLSPTPTPILDPLSANDLMSDQFMDKVELFVNIIDRYYYKDVSVSELQTGILKGLMDGVGDPYTTYYVPEEYTDLQQSTSGIYGGVGSYISKKTDSDYAIFLNPFEGGPADKAGILSEDIIYKVEGEVVLGLGTDVIANKVRGEVGTVVHLTVYRESTGEYLDFEIVRAVVEAPTVAKEMLEGNVGYISVSAFDSVTYEQFKSAVDHVMEKGAVGIIVDLRDNGGGVLDVCVNMADYILPQAQLITYTKDKQGKGTKYYSKDNHQIDVPIVVLVNGYSASASEVFTGALKDNDRATVMGTTSFGKGIVQSVIPFTDGSAIKLTTSSYYTPSGVCIHGIGITPDVVVEPTEVDNQKEAARKYILGR